VGEGKNRGAEATVAKNRKEVGTFNSGAGNAKNKIEKRRRRGHPLEEQIGIGEEFVWIRTQKNDLVGEANLEEHRAKRTLSKR